MVGHVAAEREDVACGGQSHAVETDGLHFAQRINPRTLERDDMNGTIIYPKHVHKALRRYLGLENSLGAQRFPYNNTKDFAFFG